MNTTTLTALNSLCAQYPTILDSCYVVTLYSSSVDIQANLNADSMAMARQLGVSLAMHEKNNWLEGEVMIEGTTLKVTLTT
jgi:hypothetical protein